MPQIMSAGSCTEKIIKRFYNGSLGSANLEGFIHSRDSAMLEKYKEAIEGLKANLPRGFMSHDDEVYYDALSDCIQVIGSAFAEIEGGK